MELMTINTTELANKGLVRGLTKLNKLIGNIKHGQCDFAFELGRIVYNELYVDDFETMDDFCAYIHLSKSSISQSKKYYEIHEKILDDDKIHDENKIEFFNSFSYSQITETYRVYNFFGLVEYIAFLNTLDITMTTKEVRERAIEIVSEAEKEMNEFHDEVTKDVEEQEEEEETEEREESVEVIENIDEVIDTALTLVSIMINKKFDGDKEKALEFIKNSL